MTAQLPPVAFATTKTKRIKRAQAECLCGHVCPEMVVAEPFEDLLQIAANVQKVHKLRITKEDTHWHLAVLLVGGVNYCYYCYY